MRYCETCRGSFQALRKCPRDGIETRADISDPLLGHVVGDRYRILERMAAGGMGQVYRAAHTRIASLFAVKVLYGDIAHDQHMRSRFEREAEAMSCLQSRHIVRVVDFGESAEQLLYLVMEYLDGLPLASVISRDGAFAPERVAAIGRQIARGLAHAHERGVVHRDLKPANVMLIAEDDEPEVVRVLDFGIARMQQKAALTEVGMVLGTPEYMSPEQFRGGDVDARADLYSLGVILYEMLAGSAPFQSPTLLGMATLHISTPPPPISECNPAAATAAPELEAIAMRLLSKAPDDRYHSAREVGDALRTAIEGRGRVRATRAWGSEAADRASGQYSTDQPSGRTLDLQLTGAISEAIQLGAPTYNSGDHVGCYEIYRDTATRLLGAEHLSVAAAARLRVALTRAAAQQGATMAAWEMRFAFDDLLASSGAASSRAGGPGQIGGELAAAAALVAPRYSAGDLDLVGDYYLAFARMLREHLVRIGTDATVCRTLDGAVAEAVQAGGGQRALSSVGRVLEALRQGISPTAHHAPLVGNRSLGHFTAAQPVSDRIVAAIGIGAPAYNAGDIEACLRIYRHTAEAVLAELGSDPGGAEFAAVLRAALEASSHLTVDQAAWKLRHAFDSLLAGLPSA